MECYEMHFNYCQRPESLSAIHIYKASWSIDHLPNRARLLQSHHPNLSGKYPFIIGYLILALFPIGRNGP